MARFVVSHRLIEKAGHSAKSSRAGFVSFAPKVSSFADVISHRDPEENRRGLIVFRGDARDVEAKRRELPQDVLIEPEFPRLPARFFPLRAGSAIPQDGSEP